MSHEARATERPATFREVFASREFRAVFGAFGLSWFGDYLAKAAVTALVFQRTESVALSAVTFAISFLPWLVGGPLLSALADRYPYRTVMVVSDLLRMVTIALVAVPGMPIEGMLALLFLTSLANPPAQAARSALMPLILSHDRLVVGLALNGSSGQVAQVMGYVAGAAMAPFVPELALLIDAATFAVSAVIIRLGVRHRPAASAPDGRHHLLRETGEGFRMVFGTPVLRVIAVLVFAVMLFAIVPEGLAAAWAADVSANDAQQGVSQALIMSANPIGFILGGLLISRLVGPHRRQGLVRPFAVLAPASLVPAVLHPPAIGVAAMALVCGFAIAGMMPTANGLFVQALPHGYRARAFGVMQSGVQLMQGVAVLGTGLLSDVFDLPDVVGYWSLAGVVLMLLVSLWWPSPQRFAAAIAEVNDTGSGAAQPPQPPPSPPQSSPTPATGASPRVWRERAPDHLSGQPGPVPPTGDRHPGFIGRPDPAVLPGFAGSPDPADQPDRAGSDRAGLDDVRGSARSGRHNASNAHRAPTLRGPGYVPRDELPPSNGRNAGPRTAPDDLPVRPTSPASEAPS